jgi:hypothetical protein
MKTSLKNLLFLALVALILTFANSQIIRNNIVDVASASVDQSNF